MMTKSVVFYHAHCADGMAAAWAIKNCLPQDTEFVPCTYDKREHTNYDILNKDVYFVDFSGSRDEITLMCTLANHVYVIDHHKTAQAELSGSFPPNVTVIFDMNKSGARLAWEFMVVRNGSSIVREEDIPPLILYVEDGDLWRFKLKESKLIRAFIGIHEFNFTAYTVCNQLLTQDLDRCIFIGSIVRQTNMHMVNQAVKTLVKKKDAEGRTYMIGNVVNQISETGNEALIQNPDVDYSMTYFDKVEDKRVVRVFSLRSRQGGKIDVSTIAKKNGGGGHENAAGYSMVVAQTMYEY
jgi:oligoribonuclease NrnB/cAMP/cGMP phosphodiesterase (DHH superfamily)